VYRFGVSIRRDAKPLNTKSQYPQMPKPFNPLVPHPEFQTLNPESHADDASSQLYPRWRGTHLDSGLRFTVEG